MDEEAPNTERKDSQSVQEEDEQGVLPNGGLKELPIPNPSLRDRVLLKVAQRIVKNFKVTQAEADALTRSYELKMRYSHPQMLKEYLKTAKKLYKLMSYKNIAWRDLKLFDKQSKGIFVKVIRNELLNPRFINPNPKRTRK